MNRERNPDYNLRATIRVPHISVKGLLCKIYLPKTITDPITLHFNPTKRQANLLTPIFECSVVARIRDFSGNRTLVQSSRTYLEGVSTKAWGPHISERFLTGTAADLQVTTTLAKPLARMANKVAGAFWLSPSQLLSPSKMIKYLGDGSAKVTTARRFRFAERKFNPLTFDFHFRHENDAMGHDTTFPELVAKYEFPSSGKDTRKDITKLLHGVDDLLLLVSFAERHRIVCVGWNATTEKSILRYYRRDIAIPPLAKEGDSIYPLIDIAQFQGFIRAAYRKFVSTGPNDLFRQALQRSLPHEGQTIEQSFMTLYSSIETLLVCFVGDNQILTTEDWRTLKADFKTFLSEHRRLSSERYRTKRGLIYQKINELNRIPFSTTFEQFRQRHKISLDDLWPLTTSDQGPSLSTIRNRLVHGQYFPPAQFPALAVARDHLKWTVERLILAVLGWDSARSAASKTFLWNAVAYRTWREQRTALASSASS